MPATEPLYVKEEEAARMLRHDVTWLRKNASVLEAQGFPKVDPLVGMRHKEAIEAWARERNFRRTRNSGRLTKTNQENFNAF